MEPFTHLAQGTIVVHHNPTDLNWITTIEQVKMSDISQLPPNVQERIARLQSLQNTMQQLLAQKQRLEMEVADTERALKTLEETSEGVKVYKSVGAVLIEKDKASIINELKDKLNFSEMRKKVLEKQEEKTKEKLQSLQETLQKELKNPSS